MISNQNFEEIYKKAQTELTEESKKISSMLPSNQVLKREDEKLKAKKAVSEAFIQRQLQKQDRFVKKNAEMNDFFALDATAEMNEKYTVESTKTEIKILDKTIKKRYKANAKQTYKEFLTQQKGLDDLDQYGFRIENKFNENSYMITVGLHEWTTAKREKEDISNIIGNDEFYKEHRELVDALAPDLVPVMAKDRFDSKNPYGDVEFTRESMDECRAFYKKYKENPAAALKEAVLFAMYKLDTMSAESFGAAAITQNFMQSKQLRDKMGAVNEFLNMGEDVQGPIGDVIRDLRGIEAYEAEVEVETQEKDEQGKNKTKLDKKTLYRKSDQGNKLDYYIKVCANMHMALDSDMRTAMENAGVTFKEGSGFLHDVNKNGMLNNLGKNGDTLNTFYHAQRESLGGEAAQTFFSTHKMENLKQYGTIATKEHARYMSMIMDGLYQNVQKEDMEKDNFGIADAVDKLKNSTEKYEKNKEMVDKMSEDAKAVGISISKLEAEMKYFQKLKEKLDSDEQSDELTRIRHNPQLRKYLDVHIRSKQNDILNMMARADGYLNAFSNIFHDTELTDKGIEIINEYNENFAYKDNSKSANHIRKITQYYSNSPKERGKTAFDKIVKARSEQKKELREDEKVQLQKWLESPDGQFVMNILGTKGIDVYDVKPAELLDEMSKYNQTLAGEGKVTTKEELIVGVADTIADVNTEFQKSFNELFGKIENIQFGTATREDIQAQMDKFLNMHLKYDSLSKLLSSKYENENIEDALIKQIKDEKGQEVVDKYIKNRQIINKQFTIVEDILFEYRLSEVIKKLQMGTPVETLYRVEGEFAEDSDILGVINLYMEQRKNARRMKKMAFKPTAKTFITALNTYLAEQTSRTMKSIAEFHDMYSNDKKSFNKANVYKTNLDVFMRRMRKYENGGDLSKQDEFNSESEQIEDAVQGIKLGKKKEKKQDDKKKEEKAEEKKESKIEDDWVIIEKEKKEKEEEKKEPKIEDDWVILEKEKQEKKEEKKESKIEDDWVIIEKEKKEKEEEKKEPKIEDDWEIIEKEKKEKEEEKKESKIEDDWVILDKEEQAEKNTEKIKENKEENKEENAEPLGENLIENGLINLEKSYGIKISDPPADAANKEDQLFFKNLFMLTSKEKYRNDPYWKNFNEKESKRGWKYKFVHGMLYGKVTYEDKTEHSFPFTFAADKEKNHVALSALTNEELSLWKELIADSSILGNNKLMNEKLKELLSKDQYKSFELKDYPGSIDDKAHPALFSMWQLFTGGLTSVRDKIERAEKQKLIKEQLRKQKKFKVKKGGEHVDPYETYENQKLGLNCFATSGAYLLNYWNKKKPEKAKDKDRTFNQNDFKQLQNVTVSDEKLKEIVNTKLDNTLKEKDKDKYDTYKTYKDEYDAMMQYSNPEKSVQGNLWQLADMYLNNLDNVCVKRLHIKPNQIDGFKNNEATKEKMYEYIKQKIHNIFESNGNTPITLFCGNSTGNNIENGAGHYRVITGISKNGKIQVMDPLIKVGEELKEPIADKDVDIQDLFGGNIVEMQWLEDMNDEQIKKLTAEYDMKDASFKDGQLVNYEKAYQDNMINSDNLIHNKGLVLTRVKKNDDIEEIIGGEEVYVPRNLQEKHTLTLPKQ